MTLPINKIICGPAKNVLRTMPAESISCCVSSPPYWALRDYGVNGQLGLEKTFEEYIDKLCTIYDEVKRVLRKDGTCFVNLGDTYGGSTGQPNAPKLNPAQVAEHKEASRVKEYLPAKCLCLIPQRFAIEMVNRGWILRNTIIWHKPNTMPSSAKDRFTVDFEYVYFFVKSKKYWFEPQYEPYSPTAHAMGVVDANGKETIGQWSEKTHNKNNDAMYGSFNKALAGKERTKNPLGRNKRCVWTIPTQPFPEAHFATYPEKLVEPMIKAGCPEFICTKCGKAREKIFETEYTNPDRSKESAFQPRANVANDSPDNNFTTMKYAKVTAQHTHIGYTDCNCGAEFVPGVVWDPFVGSGTTLQVAAKLGRNYGGSELKPEYIEMAEKRIMQGETGMPVKEQNWGQGALFK